ncbi:MAG: nucleotide-binding protein [Elusimicrobia bacterium]|nr:nucleotide-binding protein [Elusimicrobiota bacterium]
MKLLLTLAATALILSLKASAGDLTGTVVESMDSGGYTYLLIKTPAGEKKWAAVTKAAVKKGDKATVTNSMDMKNFESPTLKRKFDVIAFGMLSDGKAPAPAADPHAGGMTGGAMGGAAPHGARTEVKGPIKVTKAAGPDARTIAEVYAQKKELKGKAVVVSGKVVKYNAGILDRNWAHLRDGSGNAKDGSDDITVLLKDESAVDQVITVRGKVMLDKDLGGMYKFPVAIEDAVLVK